PAAEKILAEHQEWKTALAGIETLDQAVEAGQWQSLQWTVPHKPGEDPPKVDPVPNANKEFAALMSLLWQKLDFTLNDLDGNPHQLSSLRGKTVLVNFWATWCQPCVAEMPALQKVYDRLKDKGFVLLTISDGDHDYVAKFCQDRSWKFPVLVDTQRKVFDAYGVGSLPRSILIDKYGNVVDDFSLPLTEQDLLKELAKIGVYGEE
ncbi:MAG TPA: TlpA disulfide reductase family protein, partial [Fimbriimonadaceae bacterium]|nr:TlpA disulfide reductase family protein [Fimbriimonadaceae bacterium]